MLLNADMQIAQRGTSFSGKSSGTTFFVDRYNFEPSSLGTWTVSQESDAPTALGNGKSAKVLCTTANAAPGSTAYVVFQTALEGQSVQRLAKGTASARASVLSFWVKSNKTGTYTCTVYDAINARAVSIQYTISASATWEKKTITIPADTTGAITNDNAVGIRIYWNLGGGSTYTSGSQLTTWGAFSFGNNWMPSQVNLGDATNNYWQITGVQWEIGSVATAFQTATGTIQGELAACQRYYFRLNSANNSDAFMYVVSAGANTTTLALGTLFLPTTMRTSPSLSSSGTWMFYNKSNISTTSSQITSDGATPQQVGISLGGMSALTSGDAGIIRANNNNTSFLEFSSEL
jgi:hypothetical protein